MLTAKLFEGTAGADSITGTLNADTISGGTGDDSLYGNGGNDTLLGGVGNDTLSGVAGNDVLEGGVGNDSLSGGTGNDTYLFGRDGGQDTVSDYDLTADNADVMQFMSGVSADQLWFRQVSNNLEISIIGTSDKVTITSWYSGTAYHVEQFKTTDGAQTLLDGNVQNLVNAMASFTPPAAGETTLPTDYQASLAPVIAANWQ
jgi:Ca2+-binding RTX toxin-like protein